MFPSGGKPTLTQKPQIQGKRKKIKVYIDASRVSSQETRSGATDYIRSDSDGTPPRNTGEHKRLVEDRWKRASFIVVKGCRFNPPDVINHRVSQNNAAPNGRLHTEGEANVHVLRGGPAQLWGQVFWCQWGVNIAWIWIDCEGCCGLWGSLVCAFLSVTLVLIHRR